MGVSKGTIMSRLFHARQKLQRALADCYEEQVGKGPPSSATAAEESDEPAPSEAARESVASDAGPESEGAA